MKCKNHYFNTLARYINYSYIKNIFHCLENSNYNEKLLYGCLEANYIEDNKYECLKCIEDFIQIINDKTKHVEKNMKLIYLRIV